MRAWNASAQVDEPFELQSRQPCLRLCLPLIIKQQRQRLVTQVVSNVS